MMKFILTIPPVLLALTVHEFAHGWMAYRLGDPTPKLAGRLTLNPLKHLDPIGTLMVFLVRIGWAKPVPVNPYNFRNPVSGMLLTAAAGPGANFVLAIALGLCYRLLSGFHPLYGSFSYRMVLFMIEFTIFISIALGIFNLIPIPPLDGSKILMGLLPERYRESYGRLERYGPVILVAFIMIDRALPFSILGSLVIGLAGFLEYVLTS